MIRALMFLAASVSPLLAETAPYAGQDARAIASLSAQDVDDLLAGRGWGLAKPAELNGYPGPLHVLELADELGLSADQRDLVQGIYERMQDAARRVGQDYVDAETHLSMMFRMGHANPDRLDAVLARSGEALTQLRAVHLAAHLEVAPLLSVAQKELYAQLRGYGDAAQGHGGHGQHGGHGAHGTD